MSTDPPGSRSDGTPAAIDPNNPMLRGVVEWLHGQWKLLEPRDRERLALVGLGAVLGGATVMIGKAATTVPAPIWKAALATLAVEALEPKVPPALRVPVEVVEPKTSRRERAKADPLRVKPGKR